jgi:arginine exporter protein ArgO
MRRPRVDLHQEFFATRTAIVLAALLAVAALVGAAVAVRQGEWLDAMLRLAAAVLLTGWAVTRRRGGRSHRTG